MWQNRIRMESFVMCSSITWVMVIPSIRRMLRCMNTSNFFNVVFLNAQQRICHILTVIFDWIYWLRVPKYNLYSGTLFYKNVSISTLIQGGCIIQFIIHTTQIRHFLNYIYKETFVLLRTKKMICLLKKNSTQ